MGLLTERYRARQAAKKELEGILQDASRCVLVHYSCESFYDRRDGSSPRITSIAVRNLATGQTSSFSIHQIAERDQVPFADIEKEYGRLEAQMLAEFYRYAESHKEYKWLHWNMRDINYGFPAIAHRCKVLGGTPFELHESNLCDMARLLIQLFGPGYVGHPRLTKLMEMNAISNKDFLTGRDEADAFVNKEYVKLHQSTLRKVDVMGNIAGRLAAGTLKTYAKRREIYGSYFGFISEMLRDHPWVSAISFIASLASIAGLIWTIAH